MQANMSKEMCHTKVKEPLSDETLRIINKPKHPKKGEYKEQNGKTCVQEDKRTTQECEPRNIKFSDQTYHKKHIK